MRRRQKVRLAAVAAKRQRIHQDEDAILDAEYSIIKALRESNHNLTLGMLNRKLTRRFSYEVIREALHRLQSRKVIKGIFIKKRYGRPTVQWKLAK